MEVPHVVKDLASLRDICGDPHPHTPYKVQEELTEQAKTFLGKSPFLLLTTVSEDGTPTVSPKGGQAGFVRLKDNILYLPDIKGNNLIFSLQNILQHPKVGLIFLLPGTGETLRIHGTAQISSDPELCSSYPINGKPARLVTVIEISAYYFHCSMSLNIAKLWKPEAWSDKMKISWREEIDPNLPAGSGPSKYS